jgi:hypothetical protein
MDPLVYENVSQQIDRALCSEATYPSMIANRGDLMLKPPYLLITPMSGGLVILNAARHTKELYSTSMVRERSGLILAGTPLPV